MKPTKEQLYDFTILALRWYLAYYMIYYGWGKMTGGQFGHRSLEVLNTPLKDVDKFDLAWYLFSLDHTFDTVVGLMQISGAILIVINRTVLVGALVLLPILGQILLVDIAFTADKFGAALPVRLGCMIFSDLVILFYYRDKMISVWNTLTKDTTTRFKYAWWVFILMPLVGLVADLIFGFLSFPVKLLINWLSK